MNVAKVVNKFGIVFRLLDSIRSFNLLAVQDPVKTNNVTHAVIKVVLALQGKLWIVLRHTHHFGGVGDVREVTSWGGLVKINAAKGL